MPLCDLDGRHCIDGGPRCRQTFHESKPLISFITVVHSKDVNRINMHHIIKFMNKSLITARTNHISPAQPNWPPATITPMSVPTVRHPLVYSLNSLKQLITRLLPHTSLSLTVTTA
ncbi:hypothetical protein CR513_20973 [Mucuna pruriens]|uniref:Uncharacterized protein n=1 Tax=Mucuna pruriens TaxID=157652 RepID=A0A371H0R6_MUCPR|nr:hypothetical protein CR513_20973 [Mucuna pruriens]